MKTTYETIGNALPAYLVKMLDRNIMSCQDGKNFGVGVVKVISEHVQVSYTAGVNTIVLTEKHITYHIPAKALLTSIDKFLNKSTNAMLGGYFKGFIFE